MVLGPALGLTWAFLVHCRIQLIRTETIEEHHLESEQSQVVFDEEKEQTRFRNHLVHLRSFSIDFCYHIRKSQRCRYFIVDKGVFASQS